MKYVNCPVCGHKLIKGEDIGIAIVKCGHCGKMLRASIQNDAVWVTVEENLKEERLSIAAQAAP